MWNIEFITRNVQKNAKQGVLLTRNAGHQRATTKFSISALLYINQNSSNQCLSVLTMPCIPHNNSPGQNYSEGIFLAFTTWVRLSTNFSLTRSTPTLRSTDRDESWRMSVLVSLSVTKIFHSPVPKHPWENRPGNSPLRLPLRINTSVITHSRSPPRHPRAAQLTDALPGANYPPPPLHLERTRGTKTLSPSFSPGHNILSPGRYENWPRRLINSILKPPLLVLPGLASSSAPAAGGWQVSCAWVGRGTRQCQRGADSARYRV